MRWSSLDRRPCRDATTLDRRVAQVRVTDPHHPLYGKRFPVSDRLSGRGPGLIVVRLPDGRERSISRFATDLAATAHEQLAVSSRQAHISVHTLLPLANHIRAVLASRHAELEAGGRHPERPSANPEPDRARQGVSDSAAPMAATFNRGTAAAGPAPGSTLAAPASAYRRAKGGKLCRRRRR